MDRPGRTGRAGGPSGLAELGDTRMARSGRLASRWRAGVVAAAAPEPLLTTAPVPTTARQIAVALGCTGYLAKTKGDAITVGPKVVAEGLCSSVGLMYDIAQFANSGDVAAVLHMVKLFVPGLITKPWTFAAGANYLIGAVPVAGSYVSLPAAMVVKIVAFGGLVKTLDPAGKL